MPSIQTVPVRPQTPIPKIPAQTSAPRAPGPSCAQARNDAPRRAAHFVQFMPAESLPPNPLVPEPQLRDRCAKAAKRGINWLGRAAVALWGLRTILLSAPSLVQTAAGVAAMASQVVAMTPVWTMPFVAPIALFVLGAVGVAGAVLLATHLIAKAAQKVSEELLRWGAIVGNGIVQSARWVCKVAMAAARAIGRGIAFMFSGDIGREIVAFFRRLLRGFRAIVSQVFRTINAVLTCLVNVLLWIVSLPQMCFDAMGRLESLIKKRINR